MTICDTFNVIGLFTLTICSVGGAEGAGLTGAYGCVESERSHQFHSCPGNSVFSSAWTKYKE